MSARDHARAIDAHAELLARALLTQGVELASVVRCVVEGLRMTAQRMREEGATSGALLAGDAKNT